jgi:hypothetical protein
MPLLEAEQITYLANILYLARLDGQLTPKEVAALEEVRLGLELKKSSLKSAVLAAESPGYTLSKAGGFGYQTLNLSDMLYVALVDGEFDSKESQAANEFAQQVGITENQWNLLLQEALSRADSSSLTVECQNCSAKQAGSPKFCANCGGLLSRKEDDTVRLTLEIPSTGYAIEFAESTAAGFQFALDLAKQAPNFQSALRNKKMWYVASWPFDSFQDCTKVSQALGGIRNRKCYKNGSEMAWDELFGFAWCAKQRDSAYRPLEYCFGKDESRLNPWGCKQVRMDWTDWANWLSYGEFRKTGLLKGKTVWVFDKQRIRHEALSNIHKFRYCPYVRERLIDAFIQALPNEVEVTREGPWKYSERYDQSPGSIKVIEKQGSPGRFGTFE